MKFPTVNEDRLLYEDYKNDKNSTVEQKTFITYIINILNNLGLSYISGETSKTDTSDYTKPQTNKILTRLIDTTCELYKVSSLFPHQSHN